MVARRALWPGYVLGGSLVEPYEPTGDVRPPPELTVVAALVPSLGRSPDAEKDVGDVGGGLGLRSWLVDPAEGDEGDGNTVAAGAGEEELGGGEGEVEEEGEEGNGGEGEG